MRFGFYPGSAADGAAGEGLIVVYAAKLFAVATETYGVVAQENLDDAISQSVFGNFQIAQNAVATQDQLHWADFCPNGVESLLQVIH